MADKKQLRGRVEKVLNRLIYQERVDSAFSCLSNRYLLIIGLEVVRIYSLKYKPKNLRSPVQLEDKDSQNLFKIGIDQLMHR